MQAQIPTGPIAPLRYPARLFSGAHVILIVDDDQKSATALEKLFRFAGLEALAVDNGMEALSLLHIRKPKLIILDLCMPTLNGMALLRAIRQDPHYQSVPILIYSSEFSLESQQNAIAAGAQDYIVKGTMGLNALLKRVEELLGTSIPSGQREDDTPAGSAGEAVKTG